MYSDEITFGNKNALLLTARVSFASRFTYTTIRREADTPMKPHERDVIKHWHLKMLDDESKHTRQKEVKDVLSCRDVDVASTTLIGTESIKVVSMGERLEMLRDHLAGRSIICLRMCVKTESVTKRGARNRRQGRISGVRWS